jgi:hypothetical protein
VGIGDQQSQSFCDNGTVLASHCRYNVREPGSDQRSRRQLDRGSYVALTRKHSAGACCNFLDHQRSVSYACFLLVYENAEEFQARVSEAVIDEDEGRYLLTFTSLVMLLIQSDMFKALWFMIYPIVVFIRGPVPSSSTFCQVNGFFLALGIEASGELYDCTAVLILKYLY